MNWKDKAKKYSQKSEVWITILIVLAILAVVNFFSYQMFVRWDVTENDIHSISSSSKQTVRDLDDVVNIKVYFSQNLPNKYIKLRQDIRDVLDEYTAYADGKMNVEFIHPKKDLENPKQKLRMLGIPAIQFNVRKEGSYKMVRGYMGMAVQYQGNNESIPVIKSSDELEYKITMAIKKATQDKLTQVGVLTSGDTLGVDQEIRTAYRKLNELYGVSRVDLSQDDSIPSHITTLIIPGPKKELEEKQLRALDEYVMQGGNLLVLMDGVTINTEQGIRAEQNNIGLNTLLESYGIRVNHDLVLDKNCGQVSFSSGLMAFRRDYPFWPKIKKDNFNPEEAEVAGLESLVLPWVSSLETLEGKMGTSTDITYLARSSTESWTQQQRFNINPEGDFQPSGDTQQKIVAAKISGTMESAYNNGVSEKSSIAVVGDSDFVKEQFLGQASRDSNSDNLTFFQNAVGSLSLKDNLISIRSKEITSRPIISLSGEQKQWIKYGNILVLPIVVLTVGMIRYYLRKRSLRWKKLWNPNNDHS